MKTQSPLITILAWLSPAAAVYVAASLDRWGESLGTQASATFDFAPAIGGALVANLLLGAMLVLLTWQILFHPGRTRILAAIYLIIGVVAGVFPWLVEIFPGDAPQVLLWEPLRSLRFFLRGTELVSRTSIVSSYLALIGLLGWLFPTQPAVSAPKTQIRSHKLDTLKDLD